MPPHDTNDTHDTQKMGRYQLLALLATGGMAEIYLARQTGIQGFERLVVVKKILPHLAKQKKFLDMFLDEARIAAQLNHPNIVQIYDLGQEGEDFFIAMEYLEGESLGYLASEARKAGQVLQPAIAAGIIAQVCDGLDCAHNLQDEAGIPLRVVHRDVSPQNIIVLFSGAVKLVDFGVAKAASKIHQTRVGTLKGKLAYMSPEQCMSKPVDPRSDVFSLGAVAWELLTRRRLFKRDQEAGMINAILNEEIPSVREVHSDVSTVLDGIVMKSLQKDPKDRFQTAGEMGATLRDYIRRTGAAAGVHDIAAFTQNVFVKRARTKKKLLEEIRAGGSGRHALHVLKPETDESLPSRSEVSESEDISMRIDVSEPLSVDIEEAPTTLLPSFKELERQEAEVSQDLATAPLKPPELKTSKPKPAESSGKQEDDNSESQTVRAGTPIIAAEKTKIREETTESPKKPTAGKKPNLPLYAGIGGGALAFVILMILLASPGDKPSENIDAGGLSNPISEPGLTDGGQETSDSVQPAEPKEPRRTALVTDAGSPAGPVDAGRPTEPVDAGRPTEPVDAGKPTEPIDAGKPTEPVDAGSTAAPEPADKGPLEKTKPADPTPIKVKPKKRYGYLRLDTEPWSEVYLGKRKLGITPILGVRLKPGNHKLKLVNSQMKIYKTIRITIRAGRTTKLFKKLK
ncbi:MAG: protein kinase [Deltaproteobacteria bacterium]|nr:protein kinase [Deltaproteobacteria bacterium]